MSDENRDLVARWFEDVWNRGRREVIAEMLAADAVVHDGPAGATGPDAFYAFFDRMHGAFSDMRMDTELSFAEGGLVCVRWSATMKHTGPAWGIAPTGKALHTNGISIIRVAGGKLVEGWQNWDMLGLMDQIRGTAEAAPIYIGAAAS